MQIKQEQFFLIQDRPFTTTLWGSSAQVNLIRIIRSSPPTLENGPIGFAMHASTTVSKLLLSLQVQLFFHNTIGSRLLRSRPLLLSVRRSRSNFGVSVKRGIGVGAEVVLFYIPKKECSSFRVRVLTKLPNRKTAFFKISQRTKRE